MLIILDFDDTLADTSKCTIPLKFYDVIDVLLAAGLKGDREEIHKIFLQLDKSSFAARETFQKFLKQVGREDLYEVAVEEYTTPFRKSFTISYVNWAQELLNTLEQQGHTLALLSAGREEMQFAKMKKIGLDLTRFADVQITFNLNKEESYKKILNNTGFQPKDTVSIGDKYKTDLLPAHKLGITTIHFKYGRGIADPTPQEMIGKEINYVVESLSEIPEIIKKIQGKE